MPFFEHENVRMFYKTQGDKNHPVVIWAHGWGQSLSAFDKVSTPFLEQYHHIAMDFPGFGQSSLPPLEWGTAEYADFMAKFLEQYVDKPVIWAGHSFGCRVGVQMASRHPDLISGLFLVAGAGLPRHRPWHKKLYFKGRIYLFKFLKKLIPFGLDEDWLKSRFGSADYRNAGALRPLFIRVVNENLADVAARIVCPVQLVYGSNDTETPPEIGQRYKNIIKNARLEILGGEDHYSLLGGGRHQVQRFFKDFVLGL